VRVGDVMERALVTIAADRSLAEAAALLDRTRVRHLAVVRGDRFVGLVGEAELEGAWPSPATSLTAGEARGLLHAVRVSEVMVQEPLMVSPATSLGEAIRLFRDLAVPALAVLDGDRPVGLLTEATVLAALAHLLD
jgi:CBS domain-containing protein